jgi:NAD(P)-dependent dehydrogenase (short-subunit alcohol dehydrogenase family)
MAVGLAQAGAAVLACDVSEDELGDTATLAAAAQGSIHALAADLGAPPGRSRVIDEALAGGPVDVLINAAAILIRKPFDQLDISEWEATLSVNLTTPFVLARGFLPLMRKRGGSIINVSSRAGILGFAEQSAYCASKFGIEGLTRALAEELKDAPVCVNTITPGLRIKPTSLREDEAARSDARGEWNDSALLNPAVHALARLRGEVSGLRFDAYRLTEALTRANGVMGPDGFRALAE